jgi:alkaline phosphatase
MVADGMSPGVLPLAEQFSERVRSKGLLWQALLNDPKTTRGWMDMASLDSLVTDSSSASSSWGSGSRIFNGWVNMLPDGTKLTPIASVARDKGKRIGLVTTATVTHATPAGFAAVQRNRDDEHLIAEQYRGAVDVILGGGRKFFDPASRADKRDLIDDYRQQGYQILSSLSDLAEANSAKTKQARLLGLFSDGHMPYVIDEAPDHRAPSLAEMARAAVENLRNSPRGFLLQIEGARVDHAAHANDAAALLREQLEFDDAIETVLQFAVKSPETLVVITSDHGNSNPGLVGMGHEYTESTRSFERVLLAKSSFYAISPLLGGKTEYTMATAPREKGRPKPTADQVRAIMLRHLGLAVDSDEVEAIRNAMAGLKQVSVNHQLDALSGVLGQVAGNHTGIFWTGSTHTSDYTLFTALGPGSEKFRGLMRNTDVFPLLSGLMDSNFLNPRMDPVKAKAYMKESLAGRVRIRPDWA